MNLESEEEKRFILAASKICRKNLGYNGIKYKEDGTIRLKISGQARLVGKIVKAKGNTMHYIFNKRENHNDYKRK